MKQLKVKQHLINILILTLIVMGSLSGQSSVKIKMDLADVNRPERWSIHNREATYKNGVLKVNAQPKDGIVWNDEVNLFNGTIELDIKGENVPGRSFVGVAFHGIDAERFEGVYFRPFNFKSPTKKGYSVQYISHPDNSWPKLRRDSPGVYENEISPAPEPDEWFHVKIEIDYPNLQVYVNNETSPSLHIKQLGDQGMGWVGLWAGNNSQGWFKNLSITKKR